MSEIIQLYKDEDKTVKVYPKTVASEVYIDENTTVSDSLEQKANKDEFSFLLDEISKLINSGKTPTDKVFNIPKLEIHGDITDISKENKVLVDCKMQDIYGQYILKNKKCKLAWQGAWSLNYPKKNYSISLLEEDGVTKYKHKFFDDIDSNNSYHLKANFVDPTRTRNNVSYIIAESLYENKLPSGTRSTMEGFPIELYINDEYVGLYDFNTKQDKTVYGLDEDNPNHLMYRGNGNATDDDILTNICDFRALSENNEEDIENEFEDRFPETNTEENRAKLNRVIQWVMDCENDPTKFTTELEQYFNKEYLLKYTVMVIVGGMWDNISNNMNMVTYDGNIWYMTMYDLDNTWGTGAVSWVEFPISYGRNKNNLLFELVVENLFDELATMYQDLRENQLSYDKILRQFCKYTELITDQELQKEHERWWLEKDNYLAEIFEWIFDRLDYCDGVYTPTETFENLFKLEEFRLDTMGTVPALYSSVFSMKQGNTYIINLKGFIPTGWTAIQAVGTGIDEEDIVSMINDDTLTYTATQDYPEVEFYVHGQEGVNCWDNQTYLPWTLREIDNSNNMFKYDEFQLKTNQDGVNRLLVSNPFSMEKGKTYMIDLDGFEATYWSCIQVVETGIDVSSDMNNQSQITYTATDDYPNVEFYVFGQEGIDCWDNQTYLTWTMKELLE